MKVWIFFRQIFEAYSNINFNENLSSGSQIVPYGRTDGRAGRQTDMTTLIVAFRNFVNVIKKKTKGKIALSRSVIIQ